MENLGIGMEVAAVTRGQDMPLFEVSEGVFNSDPAAREFGIAKMHEPYVYNLGIRLI